MKDAAWLASQIREGGWEGGSIRLIACESGKLEQGFAYELSRELGGVTVKAPEQIVRIFPNGYMDGWVTVKFPGFTYRGPGQLTWNEFSYTPDF